MIATKAVSVSEAVERDSLRAADFFEVALVCGDRRWCYNPVTQKGWTPDDGDRTGDRDFDLLFNVLDSLGIDIVVEGEATGADKLARYWAEQRGKAFRSFPAQWAYYGKGAGPIRNQEMLDDGKPTRVVAFHRDLANSRGTADMLRRARAAGLPVNVYPEGQS